MSETVSVPAQAIAQVRVLLQGLAGALDKVQTPAWEKHARANADQIRVLLRELPTVDTAYLDAGDWEGSFAAYIHNGRIAHPPGT